MQSVKDNLTPSSSMCFVQLPNHKNGLLMFSTSSPVVAAGLFCRHLPHKAKLQNGTQFLLFFFYRASNFPHLLARWARIWTSHLQTKLNYKNLSRQVKLKDLICQRASLTLYTPRQIPFFSKLVTKISMTIYEITISKVLISTFQSLCHFI